jgi:WD40 repeat protein
MAIMDMPDLAKKFAPQEYGVVTADPQVHAARFSPLGTRLAAGGFDARLRLWNLEGEQPVELPSLTGHNGWVQAFAFSPDGTRIYSADSWGQIRGWDLTNDEPKLIWNILDAHDGWVRDLHVNPDGTQLLSCGRDQRICIRDASTGTCRFPPILHTNEVFCVRYHPNGNTFAAGDDRGAVLIVAADTGKILRSIDANSLYLEHRLQDVGGVRALTYDAEGTTLAVGGTVPKNGGSVQGTPTVLLFDEASGERTHTLGFGATTQCYVHDIHLHTAGFVMVVTSGTPGQGQIIFQQPGEDKPFFQHTKIPNCHSLSFHEASGRLAIAATNRGSNGNGRRINKDGEYKGNNSPIHLFQLGADAPSA